LSFVVFSAWVILRGQQSYSPQPPNTPTVQLSNAPTVVPDKHLAVTIPQKALWRNYVIVSAKAIPGTACELIYVPPTGKALKMDTIASPNGLCEWNWKINETQGKGSGRLIFIIDGISETHFMEVRSAF
jgi:hypothetical protein